jgi:hypothetical protein
MTESDDNYSVNVFINCPFDEKFQPIFNSIVFTIYLCGFIARCAKELDDSDDIRLEKITRLIESCQYGIHDLSRIEDISGLPRFNMPLELGIFIGCQKFGNLSQKKKKYLILESESYRFKQFISDISGQDIKSHNNDPLEAITGVRNWLAGKNKKITIPHASRISKYYKEFENDLPNLCLGKEWTVTELTFQEYSSLVTTWLLSKNISIQMDLTK